MSIEAVQTILFPLVLLAFWRAPIAAAYRIPPVALLAAFGCWTFASLNIRGYLPGIFPRERIVLGELDADDGELGSRDLLRRYNVIAQAYSLPRMEVLRRRFGGKEEARDWLKNRSDVRLLLTGTPEWLTVFFSQIRLELPGSVLLPGDFPPELVAEANVWKVPLDDTVRVVRIPEAETAVVLALVPEWLTLPGEPSELSRHYLGWLGESIGKAGDRPRAFGDRRGALGASGDFGRIQLQAFREDALAQSCLMLGSWKSPEPIALARLLSGTYQLAAALAETSANSDELLAAFSTLHGAQKTLRRERQPVLLSLLRNNSAVARVFLAQKEEDTARARRELLAASTYTDPDGRPTLGARIAMLNIVLLEQAGLI